MQNQVSFPHVWEGALFYLSAMALTDPALFEAEVEAFPLPGEVPDPPDSCCTVARGVTTTWALFLLVMLLPLSRRRW